MKLGILLRRFLGIRPRHTWEINAAARQFVAAHAQLDLDELTDRAILRGVYSRSQPRNIIRWRMARIRAQLELLASDQLKFRELLRS